MVPIGMLLVLLVAAAIRLPPLPTKDISFIDEGSHLQEGRFIASVAAISLARLGILWPVGGDPEFAGVDGLQISTRWGPLRGEPLISARPLHTALIGVAMLLLGERPVAGQMVSALFGIATVALAFSIGRRLYGAAAGLVAAAALAVSGWHAIYSTEALAEADSLFLLALALRALVADHHHRLLRTGLALGCGFLANPRLWTLLPILFLADSLARSASPKARLRDASKLGAGFALPVLAMAALDQFTALIAGTSLFRDYLPNQFGFFVWGVLFLAGRFDLIGLTPQPRAPVPDQLAFYPYLTWNWEGPVWTALLLMGLAVALTRLRSADRLVLVLFVGLFLAQTFLTSISARYFLTLVLPASVLLGRIVLWIPGRHRSLAAGALMLLLLVEGTARASSLASVSSGYRNAAAFVVHHTGGKHLSNQPPNTGFYTGTANARWLDEDLDEVRRSVAEGYYLAVVALRPSLDSTVPWADRLEARDREPIAAIANPYGASLQNLMEQHSVPLSGRLRNRAQTSSDEILIYDLRPLLLTTADTADEQRRLASRLEQTEPP